MDKFKEQLLFEAVMPPELVARATPSESPDFLCCDDKGPFLGVEITSMFPSQSDARLEMIPNYRLEILQSRRYRHVDDQIQIPVGKVIFTTDGVEHELDALVNRPRPIGEALDVLIRAIKKKEQKLPLYNNKVQDTDLIIVDRAGIFKWFKFKNITQIIHEESVMNSVLKSGFREIWVVASTPSEVASMPCRANIFTRQLTSFYMAIRRVIKDTNIPVSIGHQMEMLTYFLRHRGFQEVTALWDGTRPVILTRGIGCFLGSKFELFQVTARVIVQDLLGPEGCIFNPINSHPIFEAVLRICDEEPGWFCHIVHNPQIKLCE